MFHIGHTLTAFIATPASSGTRHGNRITALRWAKRLRELGWRVQLGTAWRGEPCDILVALHARRSHASVVHHAALCPNAPRLVALTGTDLYGDIHGDESAKESLELATRLILLQPLAAAQLPERFRDKARTIRQSARPPREAAKRQDAGTTFVACVLGHMRDVKAPLLAADAARLLPEDSRVRVVHLGAALDEAILVRAEGATRESRGRWRWLGEVARTDALRTLASADVLLLTSISEGGANVVTEAIACGVPVLSTRIEGSIGILGEDYPGYFEVGDAAGLSALLRRCETEPAFYELLRTYVASLRSLVDPARERDAWRALLREVRGVAER